MNLILKIFYSPDDAFKEIKEKKPLGLPFLILLIVGILVSLLYLHFVILPNKETILMERNIPEQTMQKTMEFMSSPIFYVITLISSVFGFLITTLAVGFIYFIVSLLMSGKGDFIAYWSSTIHIYAISLLGSLIAFPIALIKRSPAVHLDFSLLVQFLSEKNFIRLFLTHANFFTLWATFLYGLALHYIGEINKKKAIFTSFSLWLFYALIATFFKSLKF